MASGPKLPDADGELRPVAVVLERTLALARPAAAESANAAELAGLEALVADRGGAGLQRADYERGGMDAVLAGLLERTRDLAPSGR